MRLFLFGVAAPPFDCFSWKPKSFQEKKKQFVFSISFFGKKKRKEKACADARSATPISGERRKTNNEARRSRFPRPPPLGWRRGFRSKTTRKDDGPSERGRARNLGGGSFLSLFSFLRSLSEGTSPSREASRPPKTRRKRKCFLGIFFFLSSFFLVFLSQGRRKRKKEKGKRKSLLEHVFFFLIQKNRSKPQFFNFFSFLFSFLIFLLSF